MTALARRSSILAVAALACLAVALTSAPAQSKSSYSGCHLSSKDRGPSRHGPSYLKSLKVRHVSCDYAKSFVKSYYNCRTKGSKGKDGKCTKRVRGFKCHEHRSDVIPTSFDAKVTCSRGTRRIYHTYEQLL